MLNIGKVEISHTAEAKIIAGGQTEVTITINKENFSGPGRLKLDFGLADGLIPFENENDGASFTFSNKEALYIWYSIPSNETITIKYLISADANTLGNKKITGTFSYLDENERKTVASTCSDYMDEIDRIKKEVKDGMMRRNVRSLSKSWITRHVMKRVISMVVKKLKH